MRRPLAALAGAILASAAACGDPITPRAGTPTLDDPGVGSAASVRVGGEHSCALTVSGDALCWGSNEFGQLGVPISATECAREDRKIPCEPLPQLVSGGLKFQALATGATHTCGVAVDGHIYCWGDNQHGQLGDPSIAFTASPQAALTTSLYSDIVAGDTHTCGLRSDGAAVCWGSNDYGQLGISASNSGSAIPVVANTNVRFTALSAGERRTCGHVTDGAVYCWGQHWVTRALDGSDVMRPQSQPLRVLLAPAFRVVAVGDESTCALALDGLAWCWGTNQSGTMGDGSTAGSTSPQLVASSLHFTSITGGSAGTCGIVDTGDVYCWGADDNGQLGVPSADVPGRCGVARSPCALKPNKTTGWRTFSAIAAGVGGHVCGLTLGGSVYCWGAGSMGQRGDGIARTTWSPTRVPLP